MHNWKEIVSSSMLQAILEKETWKDGSTKLSQCIYLVCSSCEAYLVLSQASIMDFLTNTEAALQRCS